MCSYPQFPAEFVSFTVEIINEKLLFFVVALLPPPTPVKRGE